MEKHTPMMKQYLRIKEENRGALLLFHLGDFYEMFYEDAVTASRILHITLTSRGKGSRRMPMAGIPCHAAENYIARLIRAGQRVAICEQVEDPKESKGLVRREVTRVITPGTVTESSLLEARTNNYILALNASGGIFPFAFADVTTGEFLMAEAGSFEELSGELSRISPKEIIMPEELAGDERISALVSAGNASATPVENWKFSPGASGEELRAHFGVASLDGFGAGELPGAAACAGALISYLNDTQKTALRHISRLRSYSLSDFMMMDRATVRNLELVSNINDGSRTGSLLDALDETSTSAGGRLLRQWLLQPLLDPVEIRERQDAVSEFFDDAPRRKSIRKILSGMNDIERLSGRISCGRAGARDLNALKDSIKLAASLKAELEECVSRLAREISGGLVDLEPLVRLIEDTISQDPPLSIREGGVIRDGANSELDELRSIRRDGKQWLARHQAAEIERTGINNLKVGYNRVFGYYIEVTKSNLKDVPPEYTRKQTLVNAERFITPELKEHEAKVFRASERTAELEYELFCSVREKAALRVGEIQVLARSISMLDVLTAFAETAASRGYVKPEVGSGGAISIKEARHPVMELSLGLNNFVPNDLSIDGEDNRILIITGPNMAGKSTFIRQSALLVIMAQAGSFVPASEARMGAVDRIFTRVGASDDISGGRSTFMVEMNETANILSNATPDSFIILDEIGRGTSTYDGVSIAWAIVEHLHNNPAAAAKTLFATHYHELTSLSESLPLVKNLRVLVREWNGEIVFLRKVAVGRADKSYGIHVAKLAGLPAEVVERARHILERLETGAIRIIGEKQEGGGPAVQPLLFKEPEYGLKDEILDEIREIEIDSITPVEALNTLARIKEKTDGSAENQGPSA